MKVLLTQEIDPAGITLLKEAGLEVDMWVAPGAISHEELQARAVGCGCLVTMPGDPVDGAVLAAGPVRLVAQHAVGYDNVDLAACTAQGTLVTHTPGVLTDATADLAMALLLSLARRVVEGDAMVRSGKFSGWKPTLLRGLELSGSRLGIVGHGRIGRAVAARAAAFGMEVVHHSRTGGMPLAELLATSDVVSLHCPLTPATHHLIGAAELRAMKPTALLINTSRGPVVDEAALVDALRQGWIGGAALDVFEHEPAVHPGLAGLDSVVLCPHLGSATWRTRRAMAQMVAHSVTSFHGGGPVTNLIPELQ